MSDLLKKLIEEEEAFAERLKALSLRLQTMIDNQKAIQLTRDQEIKDLERQINDTIFDQKRVKSPRSIRWPSDPQNTFVFPKPCLFDGLSLSDRVKPMGLSCPCPRCSAVAMSYEGLSDGSEQTRWLGEQMRAIGRRYFNDPNSLANIPFFAVTNSVKPSE